MNLLYKPFNQTAIKNCDVMSVDAILSQIKSDNYKSIIQEIRNTKDASQKKRLKQKLPSFLPSICTESEPKETSNGIMQFDVDLKDNDISVIAEVKQKLHEQPYVYYAFTSPSGGLKFAILTNFDKVVPSRTKNYKDCFKVSHKIIADLIVDKVDNFKYDYCSENIKQTCYIAYDESAFFNKSPKTYCFTGEEVERILVPSTLKETYYGEGHEALNLSATKKEILNLLHGVPRKLNFNERLKINFTVLHYFQEEGIKILKSHWLVDDFEKLDTDLRSQLKSCEEPRLNYLKACSSNFIPARNSHSGWRSALPSKKTFGERDCIEKGRLELQFVIDDYFDSPRNMVVRAPCGMGKSTYTAKLLAKEKRKVLYLAPTHALAEEVRRKVISEQKALTAGKGFNRVWIPEPTHLYGRNAIGLDGVHMCENEVARKTYLDKKNSLPKEICQSCHLNPCRYILQFSDWSPLRFSTHSDLQNNPSNWENGSDEISTYAVPRSGNWKPELIIIDETFLASNRRELTNQTNCKSLQNILDAVLDGQELFECLQLFSSEIRRDYNKLKKSFSNGSEFNFEMNRNDHFFVKIFFEAISKKAIKNDLLAMGFDRRENPTRLVYDPLPAVHERFKNTPILVFDATANEKIYNHILKEPEFIKIDARPKDSFKFHQCQNLTFSKNDFSKNIELFGRVVQDITDKIQKHEPNSIGLISYKNVSGFDQESTFAEHLASKLSFKGECFISHFGNIRGRNHFDDCDLLFVIGRYSIQQSSSILFAQQLYGHKSVDTSMDVVERVARFREIDAISLGSYGYVSPEMTAVSEAFGAAETIQAIFRLRPFGDKKKNVYFYSSLGLGSDVSIDYVFDLEVGGMALILENLRSKGFCQVKPTALQDIGFNESQSRANRRKEIFRHLEQRGISRVSLSLICDSKPVSREYLVHNMDLLESHISRKGDQIVELKAII